MTKKKNRLLLHVCCGPCATSVIEQLADEYELVLFFSNANLYPEAEFVKRELAVHDLALRLQLTVINDEYNHKDWLAFVAGLEQEPEKGARCVQCFCYRLQRTALKAKKLGIDFFSTTLPISPYKDYQQIVTVGQKIAQEQGLSFIVQPFGQNSGYQRSIQLSQEYGLYRQKYCGCEFSIH
jgi:predicted adenine nucleotide alpha hydrolase (AANH) superfamily ATPase